MEILISKWIDEGTYKVSITIKAISLKEKEYIERIGEPLLNLGGTFTDGDLTMEKPEKLSLFFSDSPHNFGVDASQFAGNLKLMAQNWLDVMIDRLTAIEATIDSTVDTFTGDLFISI